MSLIQFFDELANTQDLWNRELQRCRKGTCGGLGTGPRVDMYPVEGGVELKADLPGMDKESVNLTVDADTVTVSGERKNEITRDKEGWHYSERSFGKFRRTFRLPFVADPNAVQARFENGVLTVGIPQPAAPENNRITID